MRLVIHAEARKRIRLNYQWCKMRFGERVASRFYEGVLSDVRYLIDFPYLGSEESFLSGKKYRYRSLRVRPHFKLIYFVDEPRVELHVVDFWDTRRDPNQLTINSIDD